MPAQRSNCRTIPLRINATASPPPSYAVPATAVAACIPTALNTCMYTDTHTHNGDMVVRARQLALDVLTWHAGAEATEASGMERVQRCASAVF